MKLSRFNVTHEDEDGALIMNARSGGILSLNQEYAKKFKSVVRGEENGAEDLVGELVRGGMLVDQERDEYEEVVLQSRAARFSNATLSLTIAPTMACNFCCPYCYEKGQRYTTMDEEVLERLPKFVEENYLGISELSVGWYGGEPLLAMGMIERITSDLKRAVGASCAYTASIVTNGYLLTPDVAERLARCDVKTAQVTIDGSRADHDSRRILHNGAPTYERILQNVKDCADILDISIRSNVDKTNIGAARELLDYLESNGLKNKVHFYLAPVDDINGVCAGNSHCFTVREFSREETDFYRAAIAKGFKVQPFGGTNYGICCAVGLNAYVVDPIGDLYKCWDDIGMSERKVGTIFEPPALTRNMIKWMSYEPNGRECKECFAFPMCMGGCPNHAINGEDKRCVSFRYDAEQKMLLTQMMKTVERNMNSSATNA